VNNNHGRRWTGWVFSGGKWLPVCTAHTRQRCVEQLAVEADRRRVPENLTTATTGHWPPGTPVPRATRGTP
jgi:hypothetical protein